jgi:predicted O-methyltransferase YrrM
VIRTSDLIAAAGSRVGAGLRDAIVRQRCRRAAARLAGGAGSIECAMREALGGAAGTRALSPEEAAWRDRIERLRRTLSASRIVVPFGNSTRTVGAICRRDAIPPSSALLLFSLIRAFRPSLCLELGTSLGLSAAYQAAALSLNGNGCVVTIEDVPALAALAQDNLSTLALGPGRAAVRVGHSSIVLPEVLNEARANSGIGFAFVDADHAGNRTIATFERLVPALTHPAVVVFDDIRWSFSMRKAWRRIAADRRIALAVDAFHLGIAVVR